MNAQSENFRRFLFRQTIVCACVLFIILSVWNPLFKVNVYYLVQYFSLLCRFFLVVCTHWLFRFIFLLNGLPSNMYTKWIEYCFLLFPYFEINACSRLTSVNILCRPNLVFVISSEWMEANLELYVKQFFFKNFNKI